jgi:hypothetical protein
VTFRWMLWPAGAALAAATLAACTSATSRTAHRLTPSVSATSTASISTSTPSHEFPSEPTTTVQSSPSIAELEYRLTQMAHGQMPELVIVPAGYEAATWDQNGHIVFWTYTGTTWTRAASSSYPYSSAAGGPADAHVVGARLPGMRHATFVIYGHVTRDDSGNAVAYTSGPRGWGVLKPEPNGHLDPSGQPVSADKNGLWFGYTFAGRSPHDYLQTRACPKVIPGAGCGAPLVLKLWAWNGSDFSPAQAH